MTAIIPTETILYDTNLADKKDTYIFISRKSNASNYWIDWKSKHEIVWEKYQIKETDMRQKTATFTSPEYLDLTTGVYCVLITSRLHEDFGGIILSSEYDDKTGLYSYSCQDHSRRYQGKLEWYFTNIPVYNIVRTLISQGWVGAKGENAKNFRKILSGLRPAWEYDQSMYGSTFAFNPMTATKSVIIRDKSWIEAIRDIVYGTGAYIDVYFDKYGILHINPYHKDDLYSTGLYLTTPEIAEAKYKFDTTNIQTGVLVKNNDASKLGRQYQSRDIVNLDLSVFFGPIESEISNPNESTSSTTAKTSNKVQNTGKKAVSTNKNTNVYNTKKKVVYLNIDTIDGKSSDMKKLTDMKKILTKNGWKVVICGVGPSTHYTRRAEVKQGIWFVLCGGYCAGSLKELCNNDWFLNPLKKNKSRVVVGFFPPAQTGILKGGKYYKHLGPAWDWQGSNSYANLDYPAKFMSQHGVPWMHAKNAKEMVSKFLAGGDNYATSGNSYKYYDSWQKHDVKWIK